MIASNVLYHSVSKWCVGILGSAFLTGFLLRAAAFVCMTVQLVAQGKISLLLRYRERWPLLLLIGMLGFGVDLFANLGYVWGSFGVGSALLKTDVLMVCVATVLIYKKRLHPMEWLGIIVMLAGALIVMGVRFTGKGMHAYELLFIGSAACLSFNAFLIKSAQQKYGIDQDVIAYCNNLIVVGLFAVSAGTAGDFVRVPMRTDLRFWLLVALGGAAQAALYYFYYRNLKRHEVWLVKTCALFIPMISSIVSVLFFHEEMCFTKALGIVALLVGAAIILLRGRNAAAIDSK